ncbi:hypothetical protein T069G_03101 [Trichoderma breve]|uniref:Uncharacterized protein n=1 Tax=Trichoderma breve TaxID=2034170 RepID=A0A9W9E9N6_9HYPO|nr:hypothetical protein T069G_03101 [Trichoderma breve]KAJ4862147.1 hypothetical protein T069G_03101 [Trichoderma breve]
MSSMSYYTNASNSTGFDVSRLTTPENLRLAAAVLPAIAYPLLASGVAHVMLVWSAALNVWSYDKQARLYIEALDIEGQPHLHIHAWQIILTILYFSVGGGIGKNGPCQARPKDTIPGVLLLVMLLWSCSWAYALPSMEEIYMAYFTGLDLGPVTKLWTISSLVSIPGWFMLLGRHFAVLLSRLTARRVSWLFRFYQEDIEANAKAYIPYTFDDFFDDLSNPEHLRPDIDDSVPDIEYGATLSGKDGLLEWDERPRSFTPEMITLFRDMFSMLLVCITMWNLVVYQF